MKLLIDNEIPFTYAESKGHHDDDCWTRDIGHSMAVQYQIIQRHLAQAAKEPR